MNFIAGAAAEPPPEASEYYIKLVEKAIESDIFENFHELWEYFI